MKSLSNNTNPLCLATDGLTQICLSEAQCDAVSIAFDSACSAMDLLSAGSSSLSSCNVPMLDDTSDSYNCTGYHPFGGSLSSRYNKHRQGFVFSNGELISAANLDDDSSSFEQCMRNVRDELDGFALQCLISIEKRLELPQGYFFQAFGQGVKY